MRVIHKASLVFLLKDVYFKYPLTDAVILCNGKQNPYTRKNDGHYVFSNLYPGKYDIEISCKGYTDINFSVDLKENEVEETSKEIRERVNKAREKQIERYKEYKIFSNSELNSKLINKFCILDSESEKLLHLAFERLKMSARAYTRILKVARTIADLDNSEEIKKKHIAEAIQYRSLDRKYWTR